MSNFIWYPGKVFDTFADNHEHTVDLDPTAAASTLAQEFKSFILGQIVPYLDGESLLDDLLQDHGLPDSDALVDEAVNEVVDKLGNVLPFNPGSGPAISADLQVKVSGPCPDVTIDILDARLDATNFSASVKVLGTVTLSASLSLRTAKGNSKSEHCSDSPAYKVWWKEYLEWIEKMDEYERRMQEWREALELYRETGGESPFPKAPTDLPPPWKMSAPKPPAQAERVLQTFYLYWDLTVSVAAVVGVSKQIRLQEGFVVLGGPCCDPE